MKAIGTSFLAGQPQQVVVSSQKGEFFVEKEVFLSTQQELLRATALGMEHCKIRFYSIPSMKLHQMGEMLRSRFEKEPMIDLNVVDFSFKKVVDGVEVHFFDKEPVRKLGGESDYVTSSYQALYRYLKDYLLFTEDLLIFSLQEESVFCCRYFEGKIDRYAIVARDELVEKELQLLANTWGMSQFAFVGEMSDFTLEGKERIDLQDGPLGYAIGAAIDALSPNEGICFHEPLESERFLGAQKKKGMFALFSGAILAISLFFCVESYKNRAIEDLQMATKKLEGLEPFAAASFKAPPKVAKFLRDVQQSIESYDLNMVEFRYSVNPFEKKPQVVIEFSLEGDPNRIEMYEQSVKKAHGTIFAKMERDRSTKGFVFRLQSPI